MHSDGHRRLPSTTTNTNTSYSRHQQDHHQAKEHIPVSPKHARSQSNSNGPLASSSFVSSTATTTTTSSSSSSGSSLRKRSLGHNSLDDPSLELYSTHPPSERNQARDQDQYHHRDHDHDQGINYNTQISKMFSNRQKYSPLPNPNGSSGSGKRRGSSSLSPMKKMMIGGALVIFVIIALAGGRHATRSTRGLTESEQELSGGKFEWDEGNVEEFESPPFMPPVGNDAAGDDEEDESFHILPVPDQEEGGHRYHNSPHGSGGQKWSPAIDDQEQDEPKHGQVQDEEDDELTDAEEQDENQDGEGVDVKTDKAAEEEHDSDEGLTAPEELTPSRGPTSYETDKDALSTEFCDQAHDETLQLVQYAIVIDAGSTGSRIHVYKFNNCGPTPALEYETFKAIQPGLSSFARDPTAAAASLDPLMEEAVRVVPESLRSCTPVEVKATAGLRLLPGKEGEAILDEVRVRLESDWPFSVAKDEQAIEIMDGKDEGVYAWITANYLLGKIGAGAPEADTMAVMDLGGASTQIVFEPTFPDNKMTLADGDHKYELSFGGKDYTLYQHSYLGYGLMRARRSVHNLVAFTWSFLQPGGAAGVAWDDMAEEVEVPNPCLGRGMTRRVELDPAGRKSVNVTMSGSASSFESCKRVVELVLAKDAVCEVEPCSFNGVYQPSILDTFPNGQLLALSYFTDRIQPLLAPFASKFALSEGDDSSEPISTEIDVSDTKTLSIGTLAEMAKDVCAGPQVWKKRWGKDKAAMAELEGRPEYCLDLTFMHGLLGLGYELSEKRELVVEKKLRGVELGWALGAGIALVEKATLTCTA